MLTTVVTDLMHTNVHIAEADFMKKKKYIARLCRKLLLLMESNLLIEILIMVSAHSAADFTLRVILRLTSSLTRHHEGNKKFSGDEDLFFK